MKARTICAFILNVYIYIVIMHEMVSLVKLQLVIVAKMLSDYNFLIVVHAK